MGEREKIKVNQQVLFSKPKRNNDKIKWIIVDIEGKNKYSIEEIKNKIIWGDAFKVLKKIDDEVFDMVFIDPPYFLQLPNKELKMK